MRALRNPVLWVLLLAGLIIRLFFAFHWFGNGDLLTFAILSDRTQASHFHVYTTNVGANAVLWPYPPGYLPWLVVAGKLAGSLGVAFDKVAQMAPIVADLAIAVCVYLYLGWRGRSERDRLIGVALVALGPVFIAISGYHGQLDPVATLAGLVGFLIWERAHGSGRPVAAGVMLGIGGLLKTVPLLLLVPLLSGARRTRDAVTLWVVAGVVAVGGCLPFYLAEPEGFRDGLAYTGVPGRGGLNVILDPGFASDRRLSTYLALVGHPNGVADWFSKASGPITLLVMLGVGAFVYRYRPAPLQGVVLLWLAIFVFSPNFMLQYFVWALPYFIMAGYFRQVALVQLFMLPPLLITYIGAGNRFWADVYVAFMAAMWVIWVVALYRVARRTAEDRPGVPSGTAGAEPVPGL